jgi:hypothetical protein
MFFELVGTVLAGLAAALLVFAVRRFAPDRVPKWLMPVSAGAAMILATISSEYGWFGRVSGQLPEGFTVAETVEESAVYRPWTYLVPLTSRFIAVDHAGARTNPDFPGQRIVDLYFFGRWQPVQSIPVLFDCDGNRSVVLAEGTEFGSDGAIANPAWEDMPSDDPVLRAACAGV